MLENESGILELVPCYSQLLPELRLFGSEYS